MSKANQYFSGNGKPTTGISNFAQTCNRLSLFMKEKGKLRDLNLGINGFFDVAGRPETSPAIIPAATVDLLKNIQNPGQKETQTEKPANHVSLDSLCKVEDSKNKATFSEAVTVTESKSSQMTIFYGGKVLVLDDIPEDRARDLMLVAGTAPPRPNGKIENRVELASTSNPVCEAQEPIDAQVKANGSDLPIARRASLHKFMAKRKDRAAVRAPYQLHNPSAAKDERNFDLNL